MTRVAPLLCVLVLSLAGCGGGGDDANDRLTLTTPKAATPKATETPSAEKAGKSAGPVTAAEKRVIRQWSDALRRGDVDRAITYWTVPAIAANGDQPVRLLTRAAIRQWNDSLTCGAKLQSVERDAKYVVATFLLTNRKGMDGACGTGVGNKAKTLFLIRDGKIAQWLRAPDPTDPSDQPGGTTS